MARNGEDFLVVISDDDSSDDEGDLGNVQDPEPELESVAAEIKMYHDIFKDLKPLMTDLPPFNPEASFATGSSSGSAGTISVTDSDCTIDGDGIDSTPAPLSDVLKVLYAVDSKNISLNHSGLEGHISVRAHTRMQGLLTTMITSLERNGIDVISTQVTSGPYDKVMYFFQGQVTARAYEQRPDVIVPADFFMMAIEQFQLKFGL